MTEEISMSKVTVVIICAALFIAAGCAWDNDNLSTLSLALIGLAVIILIISYIRHKKKDK